MTQDVTATLRPKAERESSLDWWMTLDGPPTDAERQERARLVKLCVFAWDEARKGEQGFPNIQAGFPANTVCGHLADAVSELMGVPRDQVVRWMETFAKNKTRSREDDGDSWLDWRLRQYFTTEWVR